MQINLWKTALNQLDRTGVRNSGIEEANQHFVLAASQLALDLHIDLQSPFFGRACFRRQELSYIRAQRADVSWEKLLRSDLHDDVVGIIPLIEITLEYQREIRTFAVELDGW